MTSSSDYANILPILDHTWHRAITDSTFTKLYERKDHCLLVIKKMAENFIKTKDWAIGVYGSYSRGDISKYSDIDLVLIGIGYKDYKVYKKWHEACESALGKISIQFVPNPILPYKIHDISSLFQMLEIRFICGDMASFRHYFKSTFNTIYNKSIDDIVMLYKSDPLRSHECFVHGSPHYYNIKRGMGGIIGYELGLLLKTFIKMKHKLAPKQFTDLLTIS